jgi:hypothetical protein
LDHASPPSSLSAPPPASVEFFASLSLTFSYSYEAYGHWKTVPLKEGGEEMEVTAENAREYVELYLLWVLEDSIKSHFEAFRKGFLKVKRPCLVFELLRHPLSL